MLSGPSYYSPLSSGDKNVPPYVISSVKLVLSAFQRQKLENAEEECRRMAKTSRGEHLSILFSPQPVTNRSLHSMSCFPSELEQSVELSKKDCQLLKEENLCRQQELKQVKPGFQFPPIKASVMVALYWIYITSLLECSCLYNDVIRIGGDMKGAALSGE